MSPNLGHCYCLHHGHTAAAVGLARLHSTNPPPPLSSLLLHTLHLPQSACRPARIVLSSVSRSPSCVVARLTNSHRIPLHCRRLTAKHPSFPLRSRCCSLFVLPDSLLRNLHSVLIIVKATLPSFVRRAFSRITTIHLLSSKTFATTPLHVSLSSSLD